MEFRKPDDASANVSNLHEIDEPCLRATGVVKCRVCECYDKCLPRYCCGFPASSLMQWRFHLINLLIAYIEKRKVPDYQAAQLAAVDDGLDALYEGLANDARETGRCTRTGT